ncbi:MAG: hypothetical protein RQ754_08795 [Desulfuromonadales bacterium]|nr:hypothetical protein [Desulfuromonadales bacterium]
MVGRFLIVFMLVFGFVVDGVASPFVGSVSISEESFRVVGSGFGAQSPLILFDDFEYGVQGENLYSYPNWDKWNGLKPPVFSTTKPYAGSQSAFYKLGESTTDDFHGVGASFAPQSEIYVSFYIWWADTTDSNGDPAANLKFSRLNTDTLYNGVPLLLFTYQPQKDNNILGPQQIVYNAGSKYITYYVNGGDRFDISPNKWHRMEIYWKRGTNNDGAYYYYSDFDDSDSDASYKTGITTVDDGSTGINRFLMEVSATGVDMSNPPDAWIDNVYISSGQSRVELCNSSSWGTRSRCEPQIITSWKEDEILFDLNGGGFSAGESVYLFVVDSENRLSKSYGPLIVPSGKATTGGIEPPFLKQPITK